MAVVAAVPLCASQLAATRRRSLSSEPSARYSSAHYSPAVARVNCWRNSFLTSSGLLLLFLLQKNWNPNSVLHCQNPVVVQDYGEGCPHVCWSVVVVTSFPLEFTCACKSSVTTCFYLTKKMQTEIDVQQHA
jgi:hypothetical protein